MKLKVKELRQLIKEYQEDYDESIPADIEFVLGKPQDSYPPTAQEFAQEINKNEPPDAFGKLAEEQSHWEEYGVKTGAELAHTLNIEMFSDICKEENNFRPRNWSNYATKNWLEQEGFMLY